MPTSPRDLHWRQSSPSTKLISPPEAFWADRSVIPICEDHHFSHPLSLSRISSALDGWRNSFADISCFHSCWVCLLLLSSTAEDIEALTRCCREKRKTFYNAAILNGDQFVWELCNERNTRANCLKTFCWNYYPKLSDRVVSEEVAKVHKKDLNLIVSLWTK